MSNVQLNASRDPIDLTHFVFSAGSIGRLKVLSTEVVLPGDSYELDLCGSFRLSPLRRGLVTDCHVDFFTFYVPFRHVYGSTWVDLMKAGIPKSGNAATLPTDTTATATTANKGQTTEFLGFHAPAGSSAQVPKFYYQSYLQIFNNYFKSPYDADITTALASLDVATMMDGFNASKLEAMWTKPLNPNVSTSSYVKPDATLGVDIMALNTAYGKLQTQQERDNFMQRYRDIMSDAGGSTFYDADNRPQLVMRTSQWASGYDVDGTSQDSLGQFSGRVQQAFHHQVPRWHVPEHGVMMTLCLPRFPVVHQQEIPYWVGKAASLDYYDLSGDPALVGNMPPRQMPYSYFFADVTAATAYKAMFPEGQQLRYAASHVDRRYGDMQGYPFLSHSPKTEREAIFNIDGDYDAVFQTNQLGDWNIQAKANVTCLRRLPTARSAIMTN